MKSIYHMSQSQAKGVVIEVGNKMFGRKWKFHNEEDEIDLDTLPSKYNTRVSGKAIEAMTLSEIVREMMESDQKLTVTYSRDG